MPKSLSRWTFFQLFYCIGSYFDVFFCENSFWWIAILVWNLLYYGQNKFLILHSCLSRGRINYSDKRTWGKTIEFYPIIYSSKVFCLKHKISITNQQIGFSKLDKLAHRSSNDFSLENALSYFSSPSLPLRIEPPDSRGLTTNNHICYYKAKDIPEDRTVQWG